VADHALTPAERRVKDKNRRRQQKLERKSSATQRKKRRIKILGYEN